jgi:hypothetical protein
MTALVLALLASFRAATRSRLELAAEILALRHQLAVLHRATRKRPRLRPIDRLLWVLLSTVWPQWRRAVRSALTPADRRGLSVDADQSCGRAPRREFGAKPAAPRRPFSPSGIGRA